MRYYTGVGSRETPGAILDLMREIASCLAEEGYVLRSGGAAGADTAFELGAGYSSQIFIPWDGFNGRSSTTTNVFTLSDGKKDLAYKLAQEIHPAWDKCGVGAKALHARNIYQVLGLELDRPSKFLICYAQPISNGVKGGTNTAVQVALRNGIKVFNLYETETLERFEKYVSERNRV